MAAKPVIDPDFALLSNLADHAQRLIKEFVELPREDRQGASELLSELEHVVEEFKRLRPTPIFKRESHLRIVNAAHTAAINSNAHPRNDKCAICVEPINGAKNIFEQNGDAYHAECLPHCWLCDKLIPAGNCLKVSRDSFDLSWRARHAVCPFGTA